MTAQPRIPLSLRVSVTDRCGLRCLYCMPSRGVVEASRGDMLTFEEIVRFVCTARSHFGLSKVRITGGEPLTRRGIVDLVRMLSNERIPDLSLTTNGQDLAEMAEDLKDAGLQRINVSLDSQDEQTYERITRGGSLHRTLEGIKAALKHQLSPVKINTVVLRGHNDEEVVELARFAMNIGCHIRFLELMPVGCVRPVFDDLFVSTSEVRTRLEGSFSLQPMICDTGQTSRDFLATDRKGRRGVIGFISPQTHPFCGGCSRLRLTNTGRLISCLAERRGVSIRDLVRSESRFADESIAKIMAGELMKKSGRGSHFSLEPMVTVGG